MVPVVRLDEDLNLRIDGVFSRQDRAAGAGGSPFHGNRFSASKAVLPANGFSLGHHPARLLADFSIERIHSERWLLAHALDEPRPWRQPTRVIVNLQHAVLHERCHFEPEFPLSRLHAWIVPSVGPRPREPLRRASG